MKKFISYLLVISLVLVWQFATITKTAKAAGLTSLSDVMTRQTKSEVSSHAITFTTPTGVDAGQKIVITFPSGFNRESGIDHTDVDLYAGEEKTLAAAANAATWGATFAGTDPAVLTIVSGTDTIAATTEIVIQIGTGVADSADKSITNPSSASSYTVSMAIKTAANADVDTGQIGIVVLESDQIAVTGAVDPTISFSINNTTIGFGHFVSTNIRYANAAGTGDTSNPGGGDPVQLIASTNGVGGVSISIRSEGDGSNAGLYSTTTTDIFAADTPANVAAGSQKYAVYGAASSGLTITEALDGDGNSDLAISRSPQVLASNTSGPIDNETVDLALKAAASNTTKAGVYSDTLTVICTANF